MPKFIGTLRQDAWIYHDFTVEANSPQEAADLALGQWMGEDNGIVFTETGHDGFDHADCEADDVVEVDEDGEINPVRSQR